MYELSSRLEGCNFVGVPLRPDFTLDPNAMLGAIAEDRPAVIFLSYPNNPTANLFDRTAIDAVLRGCPRAGRHRRGLSAVRAGHLDAASAQLADVLVLRTLAKLGLAGVRLGYLSGEPE